LYVVDGVEKKNPWAAVIEKGFFGWAARKHL
jgi:hypothetical protein